MKAFAETFKECVFYEFIYIYSLVLLFILNNKVLGENGRKKSDRFLSTLRPFKLTLSSECD